MWVWLYPKPWVSDTTTCVWLDGKDTRVWLYTLPNVIVYMSMTILINVWMIVVITHLVALNDWYQYLIVKKNIWIQNSEEVREECSCKWSIHGPLTGMVPGLDLNFFSREPSWLLREFSRGPNWVLGSHISLISARSTCARSAHHERGARSPCGRGPGPA